MSEHFFSDFPLANQFDLPGSQFIWYISDPSMLVHASLSQNEFYCKGLWVEHHLTLLPHWLARRLFCTCVIGKVSWFEEWEICDLGRAQPPLIFCYSHLGIQVNREWISSYFTLMGKGATSASFLNVSMGEGKSRIFLLRQVVLPCNSVSNSVSKVSAKCEHRLNTLLNVQGLKTLISMHHFSEIHKNSNRYQERNTEREREREMRGLNKRKWTFPG